MATASNYYKNLKKRNFKIDKYDDDDCGDDDDVSLDERKKKLQCIRNNNNKHLQLPGGVALEYNEVLPSKLCKKISDYLTVVFGSIYIHAISDTSITSCIPYVIRDILEYNGIYFKTIKSFNVTRNLYEPIWFTYNYNLSELNIIISKSMVEKITIKNEQAPVHFTSGLIDLSIFNPNFSTETDLSDSINPGVLNTIILSDHVSQHIIADITERITKRRIYNDSLLNIDDYSDEERIINKYKSIGSKPLHQNWTKSGITLCSLLDITIVPKTYDELQSFDSLDKTIVSNSQFDVVF